MNFRFAASFVALAITSLPACGGDAAACIAPVSYFALDPTSDDAALGAYERVSPDGRFILRSYSGARLGEVSLIELPPDAGAPIRARPTPLSNEAFPVQGSWRYLVDVNGDHYRFRDVLLQGSGARPLFRGGMTGFYAAASEMSVQSAPNGGGLETTIRSLSWPQSVGVEAGGAQGSADPGGSGPLQIRTIRIRDDGVEARIVQDSGAQYVCTARSLEDGSVYGLPMISIDGREFSAVPQAPASGAPTMRVYGLAAEPFAQMHACEQRIDLSLTPAKAVFGFPDPQQQQASHVAPLVYTDNASVYFFDRSIGAAGAAFPIDDLESGVLASAFPGLTRDGRVVFGATWKDCAGSACGARAGYVVADPFQSSAYRAHWAALGRPPLRGCITRLEVERERAAFAVAHGLS